VSFGSSCYPIFWKKTGYLKKTTKSLSIWKIMSTFVWNMPIEIDNEKKVLKITMKQ